MPHPSNQAKPRAPCPSLGGILHHRLDNPVRICSHCVCVQGEPHPGEGAAADSKGGEREREIHKSAARSGSGGPPFAGQCRNGGQGTRREIRDTQRAGTLRPSDRDCRRAPQPFRDHLPLPPGPRDFPREQRAHCRRRGRRMPQRSGPPAAGLWLPSGLSRLRADLAS